MEIELTGTTFRIEGAANPIGTALGEALVSSGAQPVADGLPDLLVVSMPLLPDGSFDWPHAEASARRQGAAMKERGAGRIVFLLSALAGLPMRRHPEQSMHMASAQALMRSLAMSLGPEVIVNALGTGAIGATDDLISGDAAMLGHVSVGRPGTVEEARDAALFLCDPANSYLTGQTLLADGGWSAGYGRNF